MQTPATLTACALAFVLTSPPLSAQDSARTPDPYQCTLTRSKREGKVAFARRCAEDFIKRGGYTTVPVQDTSLVARERIEFGGVRDALAQRHGTLQPTAQSVGCSSTGCSATFRYADTSLACVFRVVTMTADFREMLVQHQDATYAPGTVGARRCAARRAAR